MSSNISTSFQATFQATFQLHLITALMVVFSFSLSLVVWGRS